MELDERIFSLSRLRERAGVRGIPSPHPPKPSAWAPPSPAGGRGDVKRLVTVLLLAVVMAAPLAACGKKGSLEPPPDSEYPRKYPSR